MSTHEGWTNYATWAVNLWLDNDEGLYREVKGMARSAHTVHALKNDLREWVEGMAPELKSLWADLLTSALSDVNWMEIAESKWEEYRDDSETEENEAS